jgi:predicted ferric reductase
VRGNALAAFWIGVYLLLVSAPLIVLMTGPLPPGAGFWWEFSMGLGFAGMAVMGVQFALTARFRRATAPFGLDIIYYFHRYAAIVGLGLVLSHFGILWFRFPETLGRLNPLEAPAYLTAGRTALVLFVIVIVTSLWRKRLRIDYDWWRIMHALLATTAFILALVHIYQAGYYTETPWKFWLWTVITVFWVSLIAHVRVLKPWRMQRTPYRIAEVGAERGQSWTIALEPEGHAGLRFAPGQFAWLTARGRPFRFQEHPFSFAGSAARPERLEFTIKELGDFTSTVKDLQAGERVYLDGPYGVFSVDRYPRAPGFVFIAGGVGITPIMSNLRTLAERGDPRPLYLVYGNPRWDDVIFREELDGLAKRVDLTVIHVLTEPPPDWSGERGYVTQELLERVLPPARTGLEYFLCGPKPMSDGVQRALHALGVPRAHVHFELFDLV